MSLKYFLAIDNKKIFAMKIDTTMIKNIEELFTVMSNYTRCRIK